MVIDSRNRSDLKENVNLHLITRYTVFCPQNVYFRYVSGDIGVDR